MSNEPTLGALRAAAAIVRQFTPFDLTAKIITPIAEIIDRDTGAAELLALIKDIAEETQVFETGPRRYSGDSFLPASLTKRIRAAIAKAEGRA